MTILEVSMTMVEVRMATRGPQPVSLGAWMQPPRL
jgi:hypothetical protein